MRFSHVPCNMMVVGRQLSFMKELIRDVAADAAQGIVVTRRPSDFYGAAPSLHIQNRYGADFTAQLLYSRKHTDEAMWAMWDTVAAEAENDTAFRSLIAHNRELNVSHIVVVADVINWLTPHLDCAFVLTGSVAPSWGVCDPVPAGHCAAVDLTDLRRPTSKILPLDQENATV
jgi:hypothetical protein